jgi:hypothetical protein
MPQGRPPKLRAGSHAHRPSSHTTVPREKKFLILGLMSHPPIRGFSNVSVYEITH